MKKDDGFTYIEIVVSITIFLIAIIPAMEFNRLILEIDRKYYSIEKGMKNIELVEKTIRSKGYKKLNNYVGEYRYEFLEDSYFINGNGVLENIEVPFLGKKGEKIFVKIERLDNRSIVEEKDILCLKVEYETLYKKLEITRLITDIEEYYE
ncbi:prepilin-type N-terminal cleavage/methylation domain-containing protein [uncultured Fusobacterium sp.]|uniref:type II secretion system protein n=1 Tax=uncultured Fusobacterium sp. TaxID=159267 RepID=UPI0025FE364C|nr:prepilin-type N-terminal cleavage/methylation domain-containing protein [uncultured Fusobacterium sp.]